MDNQDPLSALSEIDLRVLGALVENAGRVVSRQTLNRVAGLGSTSKRRVDVSLVTIRRALGPNSLHTVRQRGWLLTPEGLTAAGLALGHALNICK
jgi:DNA-binding winged helix-turn-helix (wHTH) protein